MNYSISKIAQELGISKATVSLILNGKASKSRISTEVERQVLDFCKKVNYVPNIHAQRINREFSGTFGFLVKQRLTDDSDSPFTDMNITEILRGITLEAQRRSCRIAIQLFNDDGDEEKVFEWLRSREIDGLICYGIDMPLSWRNVFENEEHCVVGIGSMPVKGISSVNIDNFSVSEKITQMLIDSGRKRFIYISGFEKNYVSEERKKGFLSALRKNGIEIQKSNIITADFSEKKAEEMLLKLKPKTDAVICANDNMAFGTIKALKHLNIAIPSQTAVVGGDNIALCEYTSPSLTSFENMCFEMGTAAINVIDNMLHKGGCYNKTIKSRIIIREST